MRKERAIVARCLWTILLGVALWAALGVAAAQEGAEPLIIPVYALCGQGAPWGSQDATYSTRIEITMVRQEGENGEIIVSPGIVAGEVNPGETVVIDCDDILQGRAASFGFVTVHLFPPDVFSVRDPRMTWELETP